MLKQFTKNGNTYNASEDLGSLGTQYRCVYSDGLVGYALITKSKHTRQDVIDAFDALEDRKNTQDA